MNSTLKLFGFLLLGLLTGFVLMAIGAHLQQVRTFKALTAIEAEGDVGEYLSPDDLHYVKCVQFGGTVDKGIDGRPWCFAHWLPAKPVRELFPQ